MLSRVADSLYWMSRYIERAENNARIAEVNFQLLLDLTNQPRADRSSNGTRLSARSKRTSSSLRFTRTLDGKAAIDFVSLQKKNPNSIYSCLTLARENARTVRANKCRARCGNKSIGSISSCKAKPEERMLRSSPYEFFNRVIVGSHLFQGITDATMTHGEGWDFIRIGRLLERADCTSRILDVKYHILLPSGEQVGGNVDTIQWMAVSEIVQRARSYRKIYVGQVAPGKWRSSSSRTLNFPRSIRFSVDSLDPRCIASPDRTKTKYTNEAERFPAAALRSGLRDHRRHLRIRSCRIPGHDSGTARGTERRTPFNSL